MNDFRLSGLAPAAKCLVFLLTIALLLGLGVALLQLHNAYQFDQKQIVTAYRGIDDPENPMEPRSYGGMLMNTHAHALSVPLTYAALSLLFLGTAKSERTKKIFISLLFSAFFLEWAGLWGLRYVSAGFVYLVGICGITTTIVYLTMCFCVLKSLRRN